MNIFYSSSPAFRPQAFIILTKSWFYSAFFLCLSYFGFTFSSFAKEQLLEPNGFITLSNASFKPDHNKLEPIGRFTVTEQEDDPTIVFEMVDDQKHSDNRFFYIVNNELFLRSNDGLSGQATFRIMVNIVDGNEETKKEFAIIKTGYQPERPIEIVNAFSPNNDGVNDKWQTPELRYYDLVQIEIYDRAGNRLFYTKSPEKGWDGRNKDGQVVPGAYFYMIRIDDTKVMLRGVVTVLKK